MRPALRLGCTLLAAVTLIAAPARASDSLGQPSATIGSFVKPSPPGQMVAP